jgi:lipopolysaccharide export system protein LptA
MKSVVSRSFIFCCFLLTASAAGAQQFTTQVQSQVAPPPTTSSPAAPSQGGGLNLGKHDTNAPINVSSDDFVGDFTTKVGTYIGNVIVTQADYKLRADKVKVEMLNGQPNKFFADGKVVFESASGIATGDDGVYDMTAPRSLTMTGNVVLTKQKDVMRGTRLYVNLVSGESHLTAHGMPGGRVQSLFVPKPQTGSQKQPKSPEK